MNEQVSIATCMDIANDMLKYTIQLDCQTPKSHLSTQQIDDGDKMRYNAWVRNLTLKLN